MPNHPTFSPGEKCFAKVKGFPHWPARVNVLPPDVKVPRGKFPIFFYGTHEVCFLPGNAIFSFDKYKDRFGTSRNSPGFNKGMNELENEGSLYQYGEDSRALKFLSQFYKFSLAKARVHTKKLQSPQKQQQKKQPARASTRKSVNSEGNSEIETESKSSHEPGKTEQKSRCTNSSSSSSEQHKLNISSDCMGKINVLKMENGEQEGDNKVRRVSGRIAEAIKMEKTIIVEVIDIEKQPKKNQNTTITGFEPMEDVQEESYKPDCHQIAEMKPDNEEEDAEDKIGEDSTEARRAESVLNETASTIGMEDLEEENNLEDESNNSVMQKDHTDCYITDFGNLLLEIRKYAWSSSRKIDYRQKLKKQRIDSRIRLFFPWYHLSRNK